MGTLYCVCDKASEAECAKCPKGEDLNPTIKANWPNWKRVLNPQIIHYADKAKDIK